ncbi:MAG: hypothetical protein NVS4B3_15220 [Gemmatimonadaceae bacterium]
MEIVRLPKVTMKSHDAVSRPSVPSARAPLTLVRADKPAVTMSTSSHAPQDSQASHGNAADVLAAPAQLSAETRSEFRRGALAHLEALTARGVRRMVVNLSATTEVDASGLGILVLVQKRARELGSSLVLARVPQQVRYLLVLTKLDHLFEFAD